MQIVCHGYDYAIPQRGQWLGRPMMAQGIEDPMLQWQIMQVVIDRMNTAIVQAAQPFRQVTYLDLRHTVSPQEWFDELHPLDSGFGRLAERFIQVIQAV